MDVLYTLKCNKGSLDIYFALKILLILEINDAIIKYCLLL